MCFEVVGGKPADRRPTVPRFVQKLHKYVEIGP